MYRCPEGLELPKSLAEVDARFMTALLQARRVISPTNSVESIETKDVGMTAGYFSAIKRIKCRYAEPTPAPAAFVVKAWPEQELAPRENIQAMFKKDISGYLFDAESFFPRPKAYLADFDIERNRWAIVMEDLEVCAEHKVHEQELSFDEVMRMVPRMAATAAAWEGCDQGDKAAKLDAIGVRHWASEENLALYRYIMPAGARLIDRLTTMAHSTLNEGGTWDALLGPRMAELFTRKTEAFYARVKPASGATCTLCHGDLRGDNIFFCEPNETYKDGWVSIDFQLMFRGPVPSDLAYLLTSASVLPSVYAAENRSQILREFYGRFMEKTKIYGDYTFEQCEAEFATMSTVLFAYFIGFGAGIWQAGAVANQQGARVELGNGGATLDDLAPEELRQRMWWRKSFTNFRSSFRDQGLWNVLNKLPDNCGNMGEWFELPAHLKAG